MNNKEGSYNQDSQERLSKAYQSEKPRLTARIRATGRSLEEAEDLIHDVYAETWGRMNGLANILNLPAWLNSLVTRKMIDAWRHEKVREKVGEAKVAEETLREVMAGVGLDPLDAYVRRCMADALNGAIKALPAEQRKVIEAQVFGGMTFSEMAKATGESVDTLKARKRYAMAKLTRSLKQWIED